MSEATLDRTTPQRAVRRRRGHVLREGITMGLIGAAIAMLWFFIVDLAAGVPLRTPALLGAALFQGARSAGETSRSSSATRRASGDTGAAGRPGLDARMGRGPQSFDGRQITLYGLFANISTFLTGCPLASVPLTTTASGDLAHL